MDPNNTTVSEGGIAIIIDVNMPEDSPIQEMRSPSHPIAVALGSTSTSEFQPPHFSKASASLSLGTSSLDKDFVLEIVYQVCFFEVIPSFSIRDFNLGCEACSESRERLLTPNYAIDTGLANSLCYERGFYFLSCP